MAKTLQDYRINQVAGITPASRTAIASPTVSRPTLAQQPVAQSIPTLSQALNTSSASQVTRPAPVAQQPTITRPAPTTIAQPMPQILPDMAPNQLAVQTLPNTISQQPSQLQNLLTSQPQAQVRPLSSTSTQMDPGGTVPGECPVGQVMYGGLCVDPAT